MSRPRWRVTDSSSCHQILRSLHAPPVCHNYSGFRLLCSPKLSFPPLFVDQCRSCSPRHSNIKRNNYRNRNVKMQNDVLGAWMLGKCPFSWERNCRACLNSWNRTVPLGSWDFSFSDRDSMVGLSNRLFLLFSMRFRHEISARTSSNESFILLRRKRIIYGGPRFKVTPSSYCYLIGILPSKYLPHSHLPHPLYLFN